ncbi:MAG: YtxH domain-containing protein [Clostridia bacterium]|nr:YtxH domain-containing protein [Clostridia bacterium]
MTKTCFTVGMITGIVIGAVTGMLMDPIKDKQAKNMKKGATKAFRTLGSIIDTIIEK